MTHLERFPKLSREQYLALLRPPSGPVRCVIDTDTRNEIDDQFALAWALLSRDQLNIEAIYAAPYSFSERARKLRQAERARGLAAPSEAQSALLERHAAQLDRLAALGIDVNDDSQLDPQGLVLVSPGRGMELSYQEILLVCENWGLNSPIAFFAGPIAIWPATERTGRKRCRRASHRHGALRLRR